MDTSNDTTPHSAPAEPPIARDKHEKAGSGRGIKRKSKNAIRTPKKFASESPTRPTPSTQYLQRANMLPMPLQMGSQPLLIILDLNGTILHRPTRDFPPRFVSRDGTRPFLETLMRKYKVMVWSSAQRANVTIMCNQLFGAQQDKLVAKWDREMLGLSKADFFEKVQVYKRLDFVWKDAHIAGSHPWKAHGWIWDQSNTVLIDDSSEKAASEPYNLLQLPEFEGQREGTSVLQAVLNYLQTLEGQRNVSSYMRANPFQLRGAKA